MGRMEEWEVRRIELDADVWVEMEGRSIYY